jgi:chromosome segregation ATPase
MMACKSIIKSKKNKKAIAYSIAGVLFLLTFTSITGGQRTYQVKPEIEISDYKTENIQLMDAYERLMDRYMNLVERNLEAIDTDIKNTSESLVSIEKKLDELSVRMAKIEKALGIEQPQSPITKLQRKQEQDSNSTTTGNQP